MKLPLHLLFFLLFLPLGLYAQENRDDFFTSYVTPDTAVAGSKGSYSVIIKAEKEIKANTEFKIRFIKGFTDLQPLFATVAGYIKGSMSSPGGRIAIIAVRSSYDENISFWEMNGQDRIITIVTRNTDMAIGDSIIVSIGEGTNNNARTAAPTTANKEHVEIAMGENGSSRNIELTSHRPVFEVRPKRAGTVYLFASSVAKVGQEAKLLITTADEYFNVDDKFIGEVELSVNNSQNVVLPQKVVFTPQDSGKKEIAVFFLAEGSYVISGKYLSGNIPVVSSNPVRVDNSRPHIYWGDLHSHGAASRDAIGRGRYEYARYARALDFMCATDHADHGKTIYGISDREWARQKDEIKANHVPGKFIPFIGYENSFLYPNGHYNVIFNVKDENIDDVPMYAMRVVKDVQTIWSLAQEQGVDMLTIPHHCGKVFNINLEGSECKNCNAFGGIQYNEKYKRLIEIYSYHGLSESYDPDHNLAYYGRSKVSRSFNGPNYAQDAWAIGEKLGVIASSDDHTGHPGSIVNGVVAVFASELDRDTLFQAMKNRHTYGTTGERIWVDFRVNNALMGSTIEIHPESKPRISLDIMGTDSIDYAEVLKWDFKRGVYENGHPKYEIIARYNTNAADPKKLKAEFTDEGFSDSCLYYLRVKQTNIIIDFIDAKQVWAWTSPVWVSHQTIDTEASDSLKSYQPVGDGKKIRHYWSMYNNKDVNQYQIEKRSKEGTWQVLFTYLPTDPYQLDFEYVETQPDNGKNIYRLKYTTADGSTKYSAEKEVELSLDVLTAFEYTLENGEISLSWAVEKELHTDAYHIEIEEAGVYRKIGQIDANIKLEELLSGYAWNTGISGPGIFKFRLSQWVDNQMKDSKEIIVEIVSTDIKKDKITDEFVLKSNLIQPSAQHLEFKISQKLSGSNMVIIDIDGRIVKEIGVVKNADTWKSVPLIHLPAATYRVVIRTPEGNLHSVPFVVIQ